MENNVTNFVFAKNVKINMKVTRINQSHKNREEFKDLVGANLQMSKKSKLIKVLINFQINSNKTTNKYNFIKTCTFNQ